MRTPMLLIAICSVSGANAQSLELPPPLQIDVIPEQLVTSETPQGHLVRRFVPARQVRADEEVYYTVRIRNAGDRPIYPVVVTRPLPDNTIYVPGSAVGPAAVATFSVDGGLSFAAPEALEIRTDAGVTRKAGPQDYTHIRWELGYPLAGGATAIARFCVTLR